MLLAERLNEAGTTDPILRFHVLTSGQDHPETFTNGDYAPRPET